jgi:hypothetical protein
MKKTSLSLVFLPICLLLAGCGTDEYQSRLDKSASGSNSGSKFSSELGAETTIPGTSVSLRIPNKMQSVQDLNDPVRGKCTLFEIQGLKAAYEGSVVDQAGNKLHYFLYVGVSDLGANGTIPTRGWLSELQGNFPKSSDGSPEVNKSYTVSTPEGSSKQWEEIHFKCRQKFFYPTANNPQNNQEMPGTLVGLCHSENNIVVSLVFRYPDNLETLHSADFDSDWIKLIAGCVKVGGSGG